MEFTPFKDLCLTLGESPVWDDRRQLVFLCDIMSNRLLALSLEQGLVRDWTFEAEVCSLGLCESGCLIIALARAVIVFDPDTGERKTIVRLVEELHTNRFNDGKVGPDGCFWVGTMDQRDERQPVGALYRVTAEETLTPKKSGLCVSNGLAWSPDGRVMYHSDSEGMWVERHDFDPMTGEMGEGRRLAETSDVIGRPDGAACDMEGFYWSAKVSAGRINRFGPDGRLATHYEMPVRTPTVPCFCDPDLKTLLVTSHCLMSPELRAEYPLSGRVFHARSPVAGVPVARMKGL